MPELSAALSQFTIDTNAHYAIRTLSQLTDAQLAAIHNYTGCLPATVRAQIAEYRIQSGSGFIIGRWFDVPPGVMTDQEYRTWCFAVSMMARFESRGVLQLVGLKDWIVQQGVVGRFFNYLGESVTAWAESFTGETTPIGMARLFVAKLQTELGISSSNAEALIQGALSRMETPYAWKPWAAKWFFMTDLNSVVFMYSLAAEIQATPLLWSDQEFRNKSDSVASTNTRALAKAIERGGPEIAFFEGTDHELGGPVFYDEGMDHDVLSLEAGGPYVEGEPDSEVGAEFGGRRRKSRGAFGKMFKNIQKALPLANVVAGFIPGGSLVTGALGALTGAAGAGRGRKDRRAAAGAPGVTKQYSVTRIGGDRPDMDAEEFEDIMDAVAQLDDSSEGGDIDQF